MPCPNPNPALLVLSMSFRDKKKQFLCDLPRDLFESYFVNGILTLTSDSVSNVRVSVSVLLSSWAPDFPPPWQPAKIANEGNPWAWLLARPDIQECVARLSKDDNDVYLNIKKLEPLFPHVEFSSMSCRGRKEAPGGSTPISKNPLSPSEVSKQSSSNNAEETGDKQAAIRSFDEAVAKEIIGKSVIADTTAAVLTQDEEYSDSMTDVPEYFEENSTEDAECELQASLEAALMASPSALPRDGVDYVDSACVYELTTETTVKNKDNGESNGALCTPLLPVELTACLEGETETETQENKEVALNDDDLHILNFVEVTSKVAPVALSFLISVHFIKYSWIVGFVIIFS